MRRPLVYKTVTFPMQKVNFMAICRQYASTILTIEPVALVEYIEHGQEDLDGQTNKRSEEEKRAAPG